ncbi:MAG: hypothetical protein QF926_09725 [Alphaproteobacteria bacterium]|jgi:hypothetical protein|nr:hypothetical protein [Alphaproteobacteria bacterium]MDP6516884.1 hypothetical protein [Alphaproteobacteria bacterium]|tara:strand:+ start:75 stop:302 length:228 start_codon:yes stop_codon:yes gene_type:complete
MVVSNIQSAFASSVEGIKSAQSDVAKAAQDIAENGIDGFQNNITTLLTAKTQAKANAAVLSAASKTTGTLVDILA